LDFKQNASVSWALTPKNYELMVCYMNGDDTVYSRLRRAADRGGISADLSSRPALAREGYTTDAEALLFNGSLVLPSDVRIYAFGLPWIRTK
jgi:hypothetical protein